MIAQKTIETLRRQEGIGWITALKSGAIRALIKQGQLQLGLFDERCFLPGRVRINPARYQTSRRSCSMAFSYVRA